MALLAHLGTLSGELGAGRACFFQAPLCAHALRAPYPVATLYCTVVYDSSGPRRDTQGAARRRVKSGTLGMALATAIPPGAENKGPILCVGINSKESSGVSFKP